MTRTSGLVIDAMLEDAVKAINDRSVGVAAELHSVHQQIALSLTEAPYTQLILEVKRGS